MTASPSQSDTPPDRNGNPGAYSGENPGPWDRQPGNDPRDPGPFGRPRGRQPLFNAFPAVVAVLSALIVAATAAQLLAPPDVENRMLEIGALIGGGQYAGMHRPWGPFAPLVLHVFLHGGWLHLFMNMTAMVAFGPAVAVALGRGPRGAALFLGFFFACAVGGGLAQLLVFSVAGAAGVAIGASSALSGFLPAVGWLQRGWRGAMSMSVPWLLINLVLAATGAAISLPIAWAAHLGGLAAGLVLFPVFMALAGRRRR